MCTKYPSVRRNIFVCVSVFQEKPKHTAEGQTERREGGTAEWGDGSKQACRAQQTERTNGPVTDSGHGDREGEHAAA